MARRWITSVASRMWRRGECGQMLLIFALLIVPVTFGLGAVAVDASLWQSERRGAQKDADLSALAGALELVPQTDPDWLLPLIGWQTSTPPVIFTYGDPAYVAAVKEQTTWLRYQPTRTADDLALFMARYGYDYAYATTQGQLVNSTQLSGSQLFEAVYQNATVTIYRLRSN